MGLEGERRQVFLEEHADLFAVEDVDGALVGGASLAAAQFVPIVQAAAGS